MPFGVSQYRSANRAKLSLGHIRDMSVPTNGTLFNCITGASASGRNRIAFILMLALRRIFYLCQTTTGTDIQNFTVNLAGSVPESAA